ncbi:uncharacterized protein [Amphiura filiformis]|uniref:uncharacterized protein n=1 Tax=Amphiura filiformis TaxID=82378 RepID=UPI003B223EC2
MEQNRLNSFLEPYDAPSWTEGLTGVPSHKVKLSQSDTPLERWNLPGVPDGYEIYIKRDDMTGSVLGGNKVRKLDLLFADAIKQGCTAVITAGALTSNHCRTTAIAARSLGMDAHIMLKTDQDPDSVPCAGNYLLDHMVGAHVYFIPKTSKMHDILPRMNQLVDKIKKETGKKAYIIPPGGSNAVGMFGYVNAFAEMEKQGVCDSFTDVVSAAGTGGTSTGLIVGNYLTGNKLRIHGMIVSLSFNHNNLNKMLQDVGLQKPDGTGVKSEDSINIVHGPIGEGYAVNTPEELEFLADVARQTGIILDPVYSGKAAYHLVKKLNTNPEIFKGKKIVFIHTGGVFGLFDGRMENVLLAGGGSKKVKVWNELTNDAP